MKARNFLLMTALLLPSISMASPEVFYDDMTHTAGFTGLDITPKKSDNCYVAQGVMSITGSQYSQSGRFVELLKFQRKDGETLMIPTNFAKLNNAELSKSEEISKNGSIVFIRFSVCGSGGYLSLIDILKPL